MNDNFWNDEMAKEFYDYISTHMSSDEQKNAAINTFKKQINLRKSKQQPKEYNTLQEFLDTCYRVKKVNDLFYNFWYNEAYCGGFITELWDYSELRILPANFSDDIGAGVGKAISFKFPKSKQKPLEKERSWEILSFVGKWWGRDDVEFKFDIKTNYFIPQSCQSVYGYTYQDLLKEGAKIKSVRRISDNSIWSVGDDEEEGRTEGFGLENGKLVVYLHCGVWKSISSIQHKQQPTTIQISETDLDFLFKIINKYRGHGTL